MRKPSHHVKKRRLAFAGLFAMLSFVALMVWLDLPPDSHDATGTMMNEAAGTPAAGWNSGAMTASLDDDIVVQWRTVADELTGFDGHVQLFASRDDQWDPDNDCLVGDASDNSGALLSRFDARSATCLDAGEWHLFAVGGSTVLHAFAAPLSVASGAAVLERTLNVAETGYRGELEVELQLHRPAAADGFDGVQDQPVEVWVTDGDQVCVASAGVLNVAREPVRSGRSWKSSVHRASVSVSDFARVRDFSPFDSSDDVPLAETRTVRGDCDLAEGTYRVLVGPTERDWVTEGKVFVHAPPARVDDTPIQVTIPAGEVSETTLTIRNRSSQSVAWSAVAASESDSEWLIGAARQVAKGGDRSKTVITLSAYDLQAGRYESELVVRVDDFYGTEVRIPVELNVLTARSRTTGGAIQQDVDTLPGKLQLSNYPNPFSSSTTVRVELNEGDDVRILVYDMTGRELRVLNDGYLAMGVHEFRFDADTLPSGTYLYRVSTSRGQQTGTMTLVK